MTRQGQIFGKSKSTHIKYKSTNKYTNKSTRKSGDSWKVFNEMELIATRKQTLILLLNFYLSAGPESRFYSSDSTSLKLIWWCIPWQFQWNNFLAGKKILQLPESKHSQNENTTSQTASLAQFSFSNLSLRRLRKDFGILVGWNWLKTCRERPNKS